MTSEQLKYIVPAIKTPNLVVYPPLLTKYMEQYQINSKARITPFIANIAHESGSFNYTREIASGAAYEGRKDLGNVHPGDGKKFKGRGLVQVTGRSMYEDCSQALFGDDRLLAKPELLEQPDPATESACWFWTKVKKLNPIADMPNGWTKVYKSKVYNKFQWIVLRINGGQNGIIERQAFYKRANEIL